jgi:hypothetical protein
LFGFGEFEIQKFLQNNFFFQISEKGKIFIEGNFNDKNIIIEEIEKQNIKIKNIFIGENQMMLIDDQKRIWSYGLRDYIGRNDEKVLDLIDFDFSSSNSVVQVSCGNDHTM